MEVQEKIFEEQLKIQSDKNYVHEESISTSLKCHDTSDLKLSHLNSSDDSWKKYRSRFLTFTESNGVSDNRITLVFLQVKERKFIIF